MPGCAAIGCNNRSEKGFTMKCFPRNARLRKIWTERVSRADWEPSNNSFLCHVHFEADQWTITQSGRIKLKKNAIPSIFTITSTRKSPRKRRKFGNGDEDDLYIIEYLDEPLNHKLSPSVKRSTYNCYTASKVTTLVGQPSSPNCASSLAESEFPMENRETIVISDETSEASVKEAKLQNGTMPDDKSSEKMNEAKAASNDKPRVISEREFDDIEEKLRSICDGEPQIDEKPTLPRQNNIKIENDDDFTFDNVNDEKKYTPELNLAVKTDESFIKDLENSDIIDEIDEKIRSEIEITKNEEKKFLDCTKTNGTSDSKENVESARGEISGAKKRATFTIKLTGFDEDVDEIVEGLGAEPILKYKSSAELSNHNNFVTSVISVSDGARINPEDRPEDAKFDVEKSARINGGEIKYGGSSKRSMMESSDDDVDSMDRRTLKKKIKIQREIVRDLEKRIARHEDTERAINRTNPRSEFEGRKITLNACNGDCKDEIKNRLLDDLSSKIKDSDETIKRLKESLIEEKQNVENARLIVRYRDNRIRELNWKFRRALKLIERAEKKAIRYKKRMVSLQNMLNERKIVDETHETNEIFHYSKYKENQIFSPSESTKQSPDSSERKNAEIKDDETTNESIVYRTVQDIFDESNHCDDDDPIFIDNPEDFMRQFACSL